MACGHAEGELTPAICGAMTLRVGVVDAGVAGLACALAAASRGLPVQLFDEAARRRGASALIEVVPNTLRDLALGVGDACVRAGFAYYGVDVVHRQGNTHPSRTNGSIDS